MLGKILISSALIISLIFVASQIENSKSNIKEAKEIQEQYEIIKDIKTLIAKQYNISPENITKNDIIAHLPKGENWEKILLLDRQDTNKKLVDDNANIVISEDEKIKLLALKAKLRDNFSSFETKNNTLNIDVGSALKNSVDYEKALDRSVENTVSYLYSQILATINDNTKNDSTVETTVSTFLTDFKTALEEKDKTKNIYIPFDDIKLDLTDTEKIEYFKEKIRERIEKNSVGYEQRALKFLKGKL